MRTSRGLPFNACVHARVCTPFQGKPAHLSRNPDSTRGWPCLGVPTLPTAVPSAEPLHGPVDAAEDSLDGLQTAFGALSVEEVVVVTQPVKRKRRESERDAGEEEDEGEEQGQDLTHDPTFEGAPSASGLHASPSPITTTLPAAATSTSTTNPPMAEGTGFTGMPPYPAYGMGPPTTALHEATTASEPVATSSAPRWYAAEYPHALPATGTYVDVPGYAPGEKFIVFSALCFCFSWGLLLL